MTEQGCGEGAVAAAAIKRDIVGLGCEGNEESGKPADARQPSRRQRNATASEGVVAAGVEKDEMAPSSLAEFGEHGIERNRPRRDVIERAQLGADGHEVVAASELEAVSGIIEERNVGARQLQGEFLDRALHRGEIEIEFERNLEPQRLQRRGDVLRVVRRIGERGDVLVGAVADDKGEAVVRPRRQGDERKRDDGENCRRN